MKIYQTRKKTKFSYSIFSSNKAQNPLLGSVNLRI